MGICSGLDNQWIPCLRKYSNVSPEVAAWMAAHPLGDSALVNYGLHLLMQIEANATQPTKIDYVYTPKQIKDVLPF